MRVYLLLNIFVLPVDSCQGTHKTQHNHNRNYQRGPVVKYGFLLKFYTVR